MRILRFRWSRLRRCCGDGAATIDEAIVRATPWRWRTGRLNRRDNEIDNRSSSGEVDEGSKSLILYCDSSILGGKHIGGFLLKDVCT